MKYSWSDQGSDLVRTSLFNDCTCCLVRPQYQLLNQTWRLIKKRGERRARRIIGFFCYFCMHKSYFLSKTRVDLPLRLKGWRKKVKVSHQWATSSKNLVANTWFLVALATSESQFRALLSDPNKRPTSYWKCLYFMRTQDNLKLTFETVITENKFQKQTWRANENGPKWWSSKKKNK